MVGTMSLGEVAQVTAAFITVQAALNWLVDNYSGLEDCLSSVNRVASLLLALDQLAHDSQIRIQDVNRVEAASIASRVAAAKTEGG